MDDSSTDDNEALSSSSFPFSLSIQRINKQGATLARNHGAMISRGHLLVFIDDDISLYPQTLELLEKGCYQDEKVITLGTLISPDESNSTKKPPLDKDIKSQGNAFGHSEYVPFTECKTGLLAVKREDFFEIGMFEDPSGGWPNWDDVDFGYRAHLKGYLFLRLSAALGVHWDYALDDLQIACDRWRRASISVVPLFQRHPEIKAFVPMYYDKTPISWRKDSPNLILRKIARRLMATRLMTESFIKISKGLERRLPSSKILPHLRQWAMGSYMFRGYQEGLRLYGSVTSQNILDKHTG